MGKKDQILLRPTNFSPSDISGLQMWLSANSQVYAGNASQFTAANLESLSIADNAALSIGSGVDFWIAAWAYLDSTASNFGLVSKWSAATQEYLLNYEPSPSRFTLAVQKTNNSGFSQVKTATFGAPTVSTWYFLFAYFNSVGSTINICVNNGAFDSAAATLTGRDSTNAFTIGAQSDPTNYMGGRIAEAAFGKSPPGGIAAIATTIRDALYNNGNGVDLGQISTATRTAWGGVSAWRLQEPSGTRADSWSTNNLTDNNTVTGSDGPALLPAQDGDYVRQWGDISGNGRNLVQTTAVNKPQYKANIQNGLPAVLFDGALSYMTLGGSFDIRLSTITAVVKANVTTSIAILSKETNGLNFLQWTGVGTIGLALAKSNVEFIVTENGVSNPTTWQVANGQFDNGANASVYRNGVQLAAVTNYAGSVANNATLVVGRDLSGSATGNFNGYMGDILIITRVLPSGELAKLNRYEGAKYAITIS